MLRVLTNPFLVRIEANHAEFNERCVSDHVPCALWCNNYFRIEDTRASAVSDDLYRGGYAEPGKYEESRLA